MLSKRQMRRLINRVYGTGSQYGKEMASLYKRVNRQVKAEISAFLLSKANWSDQPSKDDLEDVRQQLMESNNDVVAPLTAVFLSAVTLGHPKTGDVVTARIALPMIKVAKRQHQIMNNMQQQIPHDVARISREQSALTPQYHQIPYNYNVMLQREVSNSVVNRDEPSIEINRDIQQTINQVKQIAQTAAQSPNDNLNWAKRVDSVLTGTKIHGGASGRAKRIIRAEACRALNNSTIADYKTRGVEKYRFLSLEGPTTCVECSDMDGNTYDVDDAQEGVNLPPIHPNCQCWIVEFEDEG